MAVITEVGNGSNTLFWKDKWLDGKRIQEITPLVFALVPQRRSNKRTVLEALTEEKWTEDIQGEICMTALNQYLNLWDVMNSVELNENIPDKHIWRLSSSGKYTAKSAYDTLFPGAIFFEPYENLEILGTPQMQIFYVVSCSQQMLDGGQIGKEGLPHPEQCILCDQQEETIHHLLVGCVFSRDFWFSLLLHFGFASLAPQPTDQSLDGGEKLIILLVEI